MANKTARVLGIIISLAGIVVILGWAFDLSFLKSGLAEWPKLSFAGGFKFFLSGIVVYFIARSFTAADDGAKVILTVICAMYSLFFILFFVAVIMGVDLWGGGNSFEPDRFNLPWISIIAFGLILLSGLLAVFYSRDKKFYIVGLGGIVFGAGLVALLGYLLARPPLYYSIPSLSYGMAFFASVLFILSGLGLILAVNPGVEKNQPKMSINAKLFFAICTLATLPVIYIGLLIYVDANSLFEQSKIDRLRIMIEFKGAEIKAYAISRKITGQLPKSIINGFEAIINDEKLLGKTGELLLVRKIHNPKGKAPGVYVKHLNSRADQVSDNLVKIGDKRARPAQLAALGEKGQGLAIDYRGKEVLAVWQYLPSLNLGLVAQIDADEAFTPMAKIGGAILAILAAAILLIVWLAFFIARTITDPIRALQKEVEIVGQGNFDYKVTIVSTDEIGQLSRAFDQMTGHLKLITASRDELNREIEKRKQAEKVKTDFIANISHELRTPLTTIHGAISNLILGVAGKITGEQREYLEMANLDTRRLTQLVDDLLDLSKLAAGKMELNKSQLDLSRLAAQAIKKLRPNAEVKRLAVETEFPLDFPMILADENKITQVFLNLLSNAIKFTEAGGKIVVAGQKKGAAQVEVSVKDTGIGIAAENISKLFTRFYQIDRAVGSGSKGTGLGLAICQEIVKLHGGEIWLESQPGHGSTFSFTLPVGIKS